MKVDKCLHMAGGGGDSSYAANSKLQEKALLKIQPMLEEAVGEVHKNLLTEKMVVADLSSASGPNTFLLIEVMKIIREQCKGMRQQVPQVQLFLNDLPGNDFNNIFQSLDYFEEKLRAEKDIISIPHFIAGLPGSFYERLFPSQSVHFFHSSYSLHWISQGLVEEEKLDSFNLPSYAPSMEEAKAVIDAQGLFDIIHFQMFKSNWDPYDDSDHDIVFDNIQSGKNFAMCMQAVMEPIIASHFGSIIVDELFARFAINVAEHLAKEKTKLPVLTISLKKIE